MKTEHENILKGIAAAPCIAISKAFLYSKDKEDIVNDPITDVNEALQNLETALHQSKKELRKIFLLLLINSARKEPQYSKLKL